MRIGELAGKAGVSVRSLRYYEEQGLLSSQRSSSGQRHYDDSDLERVQFLRRLYASGLSSRTIAALLPCVDSPGPDNADDAWARLAEERDRIDATIIELTQTRESLDQLMAINRQHRAEFV